MIDIITVIDIGTDNIKCVIAEVETDNIEKSMEIIGIGSSKSYGLRKGIVVNIEDTINAVSYAVEQAENMAGVDVKDVSIGITGDHIEGINSKGVVGVSSKDKEISDSDVERVLKSAQEIKVAVGREIIHAIPRVFIIDDNNHIKEPVGMSSVRLEADVYIITGSISAAQNLVKCVNRSGLNVENIILESMAASSSVLSSDEKDLGVILIDIGGGTTDIAVYKDGSPIYVGTISLGSDMVSHDLSLILKIPSEMAEKVKEEHGCCYMPLVDIDEKILIPGLGGRSPMSIRKNDLSLYIQPRMYEIFCLIRERIQEELKVSDFKSFGAGVVLTGGGVKLEGSIELATEIFCTTTRIGVSQKIPGVLQDIQDPSFSTVIGLVMQTVIMRKESTNISTNFKKDTKREKTNNILEWFKSIFEI